MSTVYTLNGKVLKNAANDKWLAKKETPPAPQDEVTIGTQTWKNVNLAIDDGGEGIYHADNVTANGVNMGTQYYYTHAAAERVANSISGWHLPSQSEWETLISYVGGSSVAANKLRSTSGWNDTNGTDDYGFTALPVGDYVHSGTEGVSTVFNTSTLSGTSPVCVIIQGDMLMITGMSGAGTDPYSIRLIKDS